ncbi:MAG: hypothetical protein OER86_10370, partial [Phycisphaerae bacterium]|nr:hypothetical protein [Phycisphaerae bacterium]
MNLQEALRRLFLVDQQLRGLQTGLDGAGRHLKGQQNKVDQLRQQIATLSDQLQHAQASEANLENEANGIRDRIEKLREQMNSAKTNKEYSTFLVEINTLKADQSKVEDQALDLLQQSDQIRGEITEVEGKLAEQEKIRSVVDKELATRRGEISERLEELKKERAEAAADVPPEPLAVFDKLADSLDGEAMSPVVCEDKRRQEYICGGCYMQLPSEH